MPASKRGVRRCSTPVALTARRDGACYIAGRQASLPGGGTFDQLIFTEGISHARGLAIAAGAQGYAAAVVHLGATPARVYLRHILPNVASTLIVSMTLTFEIILMESGLSFLGLGVQPPETSLGNMVGFGREYLTRAPWIMLAPATVIMLTTLSISLAGDWLRDKLDPTVS